MNRDTARQLSDSDFWQICHEMHPTTNYTFPAPPKLGVANGNHDFHQCSNNNMIQRNEFDQSESEDVSSSSDESLQNLYAKKSRAHRKLLAAHTNPVNTQKIYDTIDLFANESVKQKSLETCEISDERICAQIQTKSDMDSDENDSIANNADDLLMRLADNVHQLKRNVQQMSELNGVCNKNGSLNAFDAGDLIDFSDDWMHRGESSHTTQNSHCDRDLKKVMTTAATLVTTLACVQAEDTGSPPNDRIANERFPYVTYEQRKNVKNNETGKVANANTNTYGNANANANVNANEIEYEYGINGVGEVPTMTMNGGNAYNRCIEIQVNCSTEWPNRSDDENRNTNLPSPSTFSESTTSCCSSTTTTSDNSIFNMRSTICTMVETNDTLTRTNGNSHTLNTEHNRPYECEQCAYQKPNDNDFDKTITKIANTTNTTGPPNVNEDSLNSACPIHAFVTFTHTEPDVNIEVDSSIQPLPLISNLDSICHLQQDSVKATEGATISAQNNTNTHTNANECECTEPITLAKKSSFIQPSPLNTITTVDSFRLQAEWDADKNNNPFDYKDNRTKAHQLPLRIENDDFDAVTDKIYKINDFQCSKQVQNNNSISECSVPIVGKQPPYSRQRESDGEEFFVENVIFSCAASTPFAVSSIDAVADIRNDDDDDDDDGDVLDLKTKICLRRKAKQLIRCKLKYNNSKWFSERNQFNGKIQCRSRRHPTPETFRCEKNFDKQSNDALQCKLELKSNKRKSNRIGKHLKCNCKWKCCRGHLSDYDLCKTLYVTSSNPNANGKKFRRKSQTIDSFCQAKSVVKTHKPTTKKKKTGRQSSASSLTAKRSSDTNSCELLPYKKFDAIETISSNAITCADTQLSETSKKCLTNNCTTPLDNSQGNKNHLITEICDANNIDCDLSEASDKIKSLKLSQPIEKLKQALDAIKYCSSRSVDGDDLLLNNQNDNNNSNYTVRPTTGVNSLKNSFKLSESCESIFTLKPKPISYSSSLLSLNGDPFEASNRLRRLEERFKDFASASLAKKGRCLSTNLLLLSSPVSVQHYHHHTAVDVQPQQQQRQQEIPNSHSKGHSNVTENQQEHQQHQQSLATNASFDSLTPSKLSDSPVDSLNESNCELNESILLTEVLENCENGNVVVTSNLNDGNNNHIESKTNNINVEPSDKPIDVKHHICCSHIIEKRYSDRIPNGEQIEKRKSPIGKYESTLLLVESNDDEEDDDDDIESVEKFNSESELGTSIDTNSSIKKSKYSNETASRTTAYSCNGSLKSDLSDTQTVRGQKDDENEHLNSSKSSTNNDDSSHVINGNEKSVYIKGHIQFDDNKNSLEQQIQIFKDKNQESADQLNGETDCNANVESTNQQQLNDITNRLINCTPVSISTESEEICSLFPENRYNSNASPFIYHDEDSKTKCVFDVRQLNDNNQLPPYFDERIYECYDELEDDLDNNEIPVYGIHLNRLQGIEHCKATHNNNNDSIKTLRLELPTTDYCQCTIESIVPLYSEAYQTSNPAEINSKLTGTTATATALQATATAIMRDMTSSGTLRGLLKKPNRPPPSQKNRVIFDETRNEFFDADYIILVRDECPYDEEDEEPCTCGEHELVRLCCDEGCQCAAYSDDGRTPQSPKYAPPMEFVDQAALSPPDGYKDGLQALGGVLGSHIFGAQHYQQLQVIQQLQAQRAAMIAAQRTNNNTNQKSSSKNHSVPAVPQPPSSQTTVCTECAECTECAAKQEHDEALPPHMALLSIQATSPERRFTQKEIIAGEERPKYLLIKHQEQAPAAGTNAISTTSTTSVDKSRSSKNPLRQRYVVETITMTTVTERRVLHEETNATNSIIIAPTAIASTAAVTTAAPTSQPTNNVLVHPPDPPKVTITNTNTSDNENRGAYLNSDISLKPTSISAQITGILKGGKLWKNDLVQSDENTSSATSDDETFKRSVRFIDGGNPKAGENLEERQEESEDICDGETNAENEQSVSETDDTESLRKSTLFHNAMMKPNSAVRQLFPSSAGGTNPPQTTVLTHEALKAFDESKRSHLKSTVIQHSDSDSDTIRRTIERNTLRRSLIKYEPKKKPQKPETSLEERIRQLTCDIDELQESNQLFDRRDSPTGEENPQSQNTKYVPDKSFSPSSTASSSSNSSISAYKKITDIFHKEKRQERIPEADENPIVIIPQLQQDCRCPSAPDLGVGHLPTAHHQLQSVRPSDGRRQFLNSIAPLTACVAGQRDDMSFYSLAAGDRNSTGSSRCSEYSIGDIEAILRSEDAKKVAPDVLAGTPGQEHNDELAAFAQQEATRTERLKKRYSTDVSSTAATSVPNSNAGSDDDEQNDYGFNHRPSVRGIKPRNNDEMLEEMQSQLSNSSVLKPPPLLPRNSGQSNTLPKASTQSLQSKIMAPVQQIQQQQAQSQQQIHQSIVHQQNISTWNAYYQEQAQRNSLPANAPPVYFQHPIQARHSYHQEESTIYQNCQGVAMEQQNHYGQSMVARSPTRRPESPPPLRNYHQTMVLIPYNTESYAQFTTADQIAAQQFQHQNILEYQQVTQQTIRVPIGYPLPGMQLHVVSQNTNQPYAQYATAARQQAQMNANRPGYGYIQEASGQQAIKYSERGVPEGAASVTQSDCNSMMSNPNLTQQIGGQMVSSTANNTQTSNTSTTAQQGAVFYAMNV